jgi:MFS family permease
MVVVPTSWAALQHEGGANMATDLAAGASSEGVASTQRHRSFGELVAISIFWFALNLHWAALPIFIVPAQVVALLFQSAPAGTLALRQDWVDAHKALALAIVLSPGLLVALIANPLFGLLSDRTPGRLGRRRPYVLGGTAVNVVGLAIMAFAPALFASDRSGLVLSPGMLVLMFGLMVTQLANNAAAAPFHALLPDLVPQDQRGKASGIMGVAYWLGTISGSVFPLILGLDYQKLLQGEEGFAALQQQIILGYAIIAAVIALMAVLTGLFVRETPWRPDAMPAAARTEESHTVRDLIVTVVAALVVGAASFAALQAIFGSPTDGSTYSVVTAIAAIVAGIGAARAFSFRPRANPDFSWVVLTRMLVMVGVYIVESYLQYYMADVVHTSPATGAAEFLILTTVAATLTTAFAGWASDRIGRKRLVYISGAFMALVGAIFVLSPYLVPGNLLPIALGAGAIFGLGFGAYVSVDWALVADVLPSETTFARDMGVWNIGITIAGATGAIIGGWLLTLGTNLVNLSFGYTLLFAGFVGFCVAGTVTVRNIKGIKR